MVKKILIGVGVLVVVIGIVLAVVLGKLGRIIEHGVNDAGPDITGTDVHLGSADVSIFSGTGSLKRLHIGNPPGYTTDRAFDLGEIAISVDPKSVASKVVHVRSVVVEAPEITAEFDAGGKSNLDKIMDNVRSAAGASHGGGKPAGGSKAGDGGEPTKLIIDEFRFENAQAHVLAPAFGVDKTLKLQPIVLKGLGAKQGGATPSEIATQVMRPVVDSALHAATQEYLAAERAKLGDKAKENLLDRIFK